MTEIEFWLATVCNKRAHFLTALVGGGILGVYLNSITRTALKSDIPVSTSVGTFLISISASAFLFMLFYIVVLAAQIGRYQLRLSSIDPSNSEVIGQLSNLLSSFVVLFSVYASFLTLFMTLMVPSEFFMAGVVIMSLFWIPIIAMFIINQSSLSAVIQRAKLKTLNEIQAKIEILHKSKNLVTRTLWIISIA
jgi:Zn-dependent protease with chaperone function